MRTLTRAGYFFGLLIIIGSTIRWSITYIDYSQAIFGAALGIILLGASFVYQRLTEIADEIADLNQGLDALNIWTRSELKKLGWKE